VDEALARARIAARKRYLEARRPASLAARIFAAIDLKRAIGEITGNFAAGRLAWPPRRAGLLFAIIVAGATAMLHSLEVSKECRGAFSGGFSNGFDRYRCELKLSVNEDGPELTLRLPT
jgi:hypothetical protein